jgi:hypothetical protein
MNPLSDTQSLRRGGIKRGVVTLYCYLMYGFFMYLLTIQGNIIPFLRSELHLSSKILRPAMNSGLSLSKRCSPAQPLAWTK